MGFLFSVGLACAAIVISIYLLFKKRFQYWKKLGIPHFEPRIPYGTLYRSGNTKEHLLENFMDTYNAFKGSTPVVGMYFFLQTVSVAIDLDFIHHILVKDFKLFQDRGVFHNEKYDPISANLFNVNGKRWKNLRSKFSPSFTSGKMKFMYPTLLEVTKRFDQTLAESLRKDQTMEIKDLLARYTTDIIGTCAFGIECNSLKDPNAEFRAMGRRFFEEPQLGIVGRTLTSQFPKLSIELGIRTLHPEISDFFMKTVKETVRFREENNTKRNDFMNLLIDLRNSHANDGGFTMEDLAAQAFLFFAAGFETSSTTMAFALYELALNQEIQEKARNEIGQRLQKHSGELTYEAVMEMHYVDCIIKETLRKYPPVVVLMRKPTEDYLIPGSNHIIPKGKKVFIPAYCIHHDPDIYPNPEVFDPSRFEPEEVRKRHPMSFLGFGDGPRNCIGERFGMMQTTVGLVTLLRNYKFKPCSKTFIPMKFNPDVFILAPVGGMYLSIEKNIELLKLMTDKNMKITFD